MIELDNKNYVSTQVTKEEREIRRWKSQCDRYYNELEKYNIKAVYSDIVKIDKYLNYYELYLSDIELDKCATIDDIIAWIVANDES